MQKSRAWPGIIVAFTLACARASGDGTEAAPGAPLAGLSPAELDAFAAGRALFDREFSEQEGLGPSFNEKRCSSCHDLPVLGGVGAEIVPKATRFANGRCDLLPEHGGDMIQQQVTEAARAHGFQPERIPATATAAVNMTAPPLFGAGLVEAIPEAAIVERTDPDDRNGDGISGRAGRDALGRFGRFGHKANFATLRAFIANAFHGEMGLTSREHPEDDDVAGQRLPPEADPAPDPEIDDATIDLITRFVTFLALPAAEVPASDAARDSIQRGAQLFERSGCVQCHVRSFRTKSAVPALHNREVLLYSDLLLHDMGPDRASVCAPHAAPSEWRTPTLVGLRYRHRFLHDGAAQNLYSAIDAHGGEAARSRVAFLRLTPAQQELLLRFLTSL